MSSPAAHRVDRAEADNQKPGTRFPGADGRPDMAHKPLERLNVRPEVETTPEHGAFRRVVDFGRDGSIEGRVDAVRDHVDMSHSGDHFSAFASTSDTTQDRSISGAEARP